MIINLKFKNKLIFCEKIHHKSRSNNYITLSPSTKRRQPMQTKIKTNINTKLNKEKETKTLNDRNTT